MSTAIIGKKRTGNYFCHTFLKRNVANTLGDVQASDCCNVRQNCKIVPGPHRKAHLCVVGRIQVADRSRPGQGYSFSSRSPRNKGRRDTQSKYCGNDSKTHVFKCHQAMCAGPNQFSILVTSVIDRSRREP